MEDESVENFIRKNFKMNKDKYNKLESLFFHTILFHTYVDLKHYANMKKSLLAHSRYTTHKKVNKENPNSCAEPGRQTSDRAVNEV